MAHMIQRADLTALRGIRPLASLNERFWRLVVEHGECWIYTGQTRRHTDYGLFTIPVTSERGPAWRTEMVHRLVFEAVNGPSPDGFDVLHSCDRQPCVRPSHLRLGTHLDNMADKVARGRQPRGGRVPGVSLPRETLPTRSGERHHNAKLTDAQVVEARIAYADGETNIAALGRRYNVSAVLVSLIVRGKMRRTAGGPISTIRPIVGARVPTAKLTPALVRELRARYAMGGLSVHALAAEYGIAFQTVSKIIRRVTWQHVLE